MNQDRYIQLKYRNKNTDSQTPKKKDHIRHLMSYSLEEFSSDIEAGFMWHIGYVEKGLLNSLTYTMHYLRDVNRITEEEQKTLESMINSKIPDNMVMAFAIIKQHYTNHKNRHKSNLKPN